ncbi:hypothetical protein EDC19_2417 [Natranaerovirga hydrolytica]|uniref:Uncharacterized protein n=1 Tax=Natranaerovirga hydrolytica TaxID=680378 RepID=A0A4R1MDP4_9FIRM|nr:hypothetical protein [Natranaerovirga hydrolytica]TCK90648.1 hypothetical protein EDC19_2417 [Natranaerovirga hydrolytica]
MDYIMITFQMNNLTEDIKVPTFVKIEELLELISKALDINCNTNSRVQVEPMGRILENNKTLLEEMVTQGSKLTLVY